MPWFYQRLTKLDAGSSPNNLVERQPQCVIQDKAH